MKGKALIIYSSITGNTEKVANWFRETFEHYCMEVTMVKIKNRMDWSQYAGNTYFEDYDVVCIGSPIIAGAPTTAMIKLFSPGGGSDLEKNVTANAEAGKGFNAGGAGFPKGMDPDKGEGGPGMMPMDGPQWSRPDYTAGHYVYAGGMKPQGLYQPLGIAFTTYGGTGNGPRECIATLEIEKSYLRSYGFTPVGEYACCGKELRHNSVDNLGDKLKMNIPDAQAMMSRYKENPNDEEFQKMSPKLVAIIKKLSSVSDDESFGATLFQKNDPLGIGKPGQRFWHYGMQIRPHARDLKKAEYFLTGILEDYLLTADGAPRTPGPVYRNIC